jgi:hypothetical protein
VQRFGDEPKPLIFEVGSQEEGEEGTLEEESAAPQPEDAETEDAETKTASVPKLVVPPTTDEYLWEWKVRHFFIDCTNLRLTIYRSRSWRRREGRSFCSSVVSLPQDVFHLDLRRGVRLKSIWRADVN